jgi:polyisoprenoid-binding protein YceI
MKRTARRVVTGAVIVGVVAIAVAGFLVWQVFGGNEPSPVALSSLSPSPSASSSSGGSFTGSWTVDTTSGSLDAGTSSFAGYRVQEELSGLGSNTAVGRTPDVSGTMTIEGTSITALSITVDMTSLRSDDERRDDSIRQRGLETDTFPTATFTLTQPIDVGTRPTDGERIRLTATGDLTLHDVTRSAGFRSRPGGAVARSKRPRASTSRSPTTASTRRSASSCCRSRTTARSRCTCSSGSPEL